MFEQVEELVREHADLEQQLADPAVHADQAVARRLGRRFAELSPVVGTYAAWRTAEDDLGAARELGEQDPAFREEAEVIEVRRDELAEELRRLLVPRDPDDDRDVILEVKAG